MVDNGKESLVIKYGSPSVSTKLGMDPVRVGRYAEDVSGLTDQYNIVVVTSGAVATGRAIWAEISDGEVDEPPEQSLATLGADECFSVWKKAFLAQRKAAGSILVTHHEIDDKQEGGMLARVLDANFEAGIISVINENDALSDTEIAALKYGGDNDGLATHLAYKIWAKDVLFMTGVEGVLDGNGRIVEVVMPQDFERVRNLAGSEGRNDMRSKVEASIDAVDLGMTAHIAHASVDPRQVLTRQKGTHFLR